MAIRTILIIASLISAPVFSQEIDQDMKDRITQLNLTDPSQHKVVVNDSLKRAKEMNLVDVRKVLDSDEYQARLSDYEESAKSLLGIDPAPFSTPTPAEETNYLGDRLVLFVSSSMPIHILRNYIRDLEKVGGVMVFRGTVDGISSFKPTAELMRKILVKDENCHSGKCDIRKAYISIDPDRFTHHRINRVPALIYEKDMKIQAYCKQGDKGPRARTIAYGDSSLVGLADAIQKQTNDAALKAYVNKLRGIK